MSKLRNKLKSSLSLGSTPIGNSPNALAPKLSASVHLQDQHGPNIQTHTRRVSDAADLNRLLEAVLDLDVVALESFSRSKSSEERAIVFNTRLELMNFCADWSLCTPLGYAISQNSEPVVGCLLQHCSANVHLAPCLRQSSPSTKSTTQQVATPLHLAAILFVNPAIIRLLLNAGATIADIPARDVFPVLEYAIRCSLDQRLAENLLRNTFNTHAPEEIINARDEFDRTALHVAVIMATKKTTNATSGSSSAQVEGTDEPFFDKIIDVLLVDIGLHVEDRDKTGKTALMYAAKNNCRRVISRLLKAGASPSTIDRTGRSSLHYAIIGQASVSVIEDLMKAGSDPMAIDRFNLSPIDYLVVMATGNNLHSRHRHQSNYHRRNHPQLPDMTPSNNANQVKIISRKSENAERLNALLRLAAPSKKLVLWADVFTQATRLLISLFSPRHSIDTETTQGDALHRLVSDNKELINVGLATDAGRTLLHCAATVGHLSLITRLLGDEFQLPVDETDDVGWTALHYALAAGREVDSRATAEVDARFKPQCAAILLEHGANVNARTQDEFGEWKV